MVSMALQTSVLELASSNATHDERRPGLGLDMALVCLTTDSDILRLSCIYHYCYEGSIYCLRVYACDLALLGLTWYIHFNPVH